MAKKNEELEAYSAVSSADSGKPGKGGKDNDIVQWYFSADEAATLYSQAQIHGINSELARAEYVVGMKIKREGRMPTLSEMRAKAKLVLGGKGDYTEPGHGPEAGPYAEAPAEPKHAPAEPKPAPEPEPEPEGEDIVDLGPDEELDEEYVAGVVKKLLEEEGIYEALKMAKDYKDALELLDESIKENTEKVKRHTDELTAVSAKLTEAAEAYSSLLKKLEELEKKKKEEPKEKVDEEKSETIEPEKETKVVGPVDKIAKYEEKIEGEENAEDYALLALNEMTKLEEELKEYGLGDRVSSDGACSLLEATPATPTPARRYPSKKPITEDEKNLELALKNWEWAQDKYRDGQSDVAYEKAKLGREILKKIKKMPVEEPEPKPEEEPEDEPEPEEYEKEEIGPEEEPRPEYEEKDVKKAAFQDINELESRIESLEEQGYDVSLAKIRLGHVRNHYLEGFYNLAKEYILGAHHALDTVLAEGRKREKEAVKRVKKIPRKKALVDETEEAEAGAEPEEPAEREPALVMYLKDDMEELGLNKDPRDVREYLSSLGLEEGKDFTINKTDFVKRKKEGDWVKHKYNTVTGMTIDEEALKKIEEAKTAGTEKEPAEPEEKEPWLSEKTKDRLKTAATFGLYALYKRRQPPRPYLEEDIEIEPVEREEPKPSKSARRKKLKEIKKREKEKWGAFEPETEPYDGVEIENWFFDEEPSAEEKREAPEIHIDEEADAVVAAALPPPTKYPRLKKAKEYLSGLFSRKKTVGPRRRIPGLDNFHKDAQIAETYVEYGYVMDTEVADDPPDFSGLFDNEQDVMENDYIGDEAEPTLPKPPRVRKIRRIRPEERDDDGTGAALSAILKARAEVEARKAEEEEFRYDEAEDEFSEPAPIEGGFEEIPEGAEKSGDGVSLAGTFAKKKKEAPQMGPEKTGSETGKFRRIDFNRLLDEVEAEFRETEKSEEAKVPDAIDLKVDIVRDDYTIKVERPKEKPEDEGDMMDAGGMAKPEPEKTEIKITGSKIVRSEIAPGAKGAEIKIEDSEVEGTKLPEGDMKIKDSKVTDGVAEDGEEIGESSERAAGTEDELEKDRKELEMAMKAKEQLEDVRHKREMHKVEEAAARKALKDLPPSSEEEDAEKDDSLAGAFKRKKKKGRKKKR